MPDETTNTTVADPQEADGAAKPVLETPPAESPDETVTISKAEYQSLKSTVGSVRKRAEQDAVLDRIAASIEEAKSHAAEAREEARAARQIAEWNAPTFDPEERERKMAQLSTSERERQDSADAQQIAREFALAANDVLDEAGIPETDARVVKAIELYTQAKNARTPAEAESFLKPARKQIDVALFEKIREKDAAAKESAAKAVALEKELKTYKDKARQDERESAGDMSTGPAAGGGGNPSLESLLKWDSRGKSLKELREHEKRLDAAMKRGR